MKKIVKATIGPMPRPMPQGMFDPMPTVKVEYDDGTEETLFEFYPDEISFSESEVIGLTRDEAMGVRHKQDVKYIRS